ncbi:hypothetical protein RI138_14190 [Streptomyces sp. C11-1]|uniref:DUF4232 domain-containing protein n=1 Tax=Streptomyces durocortorensis TaxID=2811104 RepID=A0ABY9VVB7_9ACTN|nr:hypothetical protein [Streptomyces durocortorensis]WNF27881.1 hypothetical protein RI138_14190 [Streptomyces durocortorensis]
MSRPDFRPERRHENDPTGNGMVNDGPETTPHNDPERPHAASAEPEQSELPEPAPATRSAEERAGGGSGPGSVAELFAGRRGASARDERAEPEELDEVALRRLLQGAVGQLEPSEGTLDRLHRAVPARRAKRRQAVVGAAAAALLIGTAVPAFVHVAASDSSSTAAPAIAGHGEQAQGGNGADTGPAERGDVAVAPTERQSEGGVGEPDPPRSPSPGLGSDPDATATGGEVPGSPRTGLAALPVCDPGQLGVASAGTDAPDADGTVYGSFKIANMSRSECAVSSNGTVGFTALGAADPLKIDVIQHAAGDAAPGLPDPSKEPGTVRLKPSMAYEVKFAWVPTDTCPTVGPSPSPTPSADGAGGSVSEGSGQSGTDTQSLREDDGGGTAEGSVTVTHTPETGAPTAETKIPNACSGTIYRTGLLATS